MKQILADYTKEELLSETAKRGLPSFRAEQLYRWVNDGATFEEMTNLPKGLRASLAEEYVDVAAKIKKEYRSSDGTVKFLFELCDGNLVEGVLMHYKYGYTLCVSTQVGCRMHCAFCASGKDGLCRNLTSGEMLSEVICANRYLRAHTEDGRVGNVVLMGSGEPLDNYENVVKFIDCLTVGQGVGQRGISLSTCGLVPNIRRLADEGHSVTLCLSLHAVTDEKREKIMPTARTYRIKDIISAAKYYFEKSGRRIIVEYAMMHGFNVGADDAKMLREWTKSFPCHVNLIPLNETGSALRGVNRREAEKFLELLTSLGVSATIRRSLGEDIEGACGQLKRRYNESKQEDAYGG